MDSIWEKDGHLPEFPELEGDLRTDVLVIGGGLAGLLCAWQLTRAGVDCVLIEENRLMHGVSGRTTAKVTSQHGFIYDKLLRTFGEEKAWLYWRANAQALSDLRELGVVQTRSSFLYTTRGSKRLLRELAACEQLGIPALWREQLELPFPVVGAVEFTDQGQCHPLQLAERAAKGLKIYEHTKALAFLGNRVQTSGGNIAAEKIVVATHFPLWNKHGAYFLKLYQQRSYVVALENAPQLEGMYLDCEDNGLSLRSAGEFLLLGGGGHRTGKQGAGWDLPETAARKYFPQARTVSRWATQDCMTLDGVPYIGQYSQATPNLYVVTGFQKWGMTTSMAAAKLLADQIQGKENPYTALFAPYRSMLHKQLLYNGLETTVNLLRPTAPRCPHLGCALHWNRAERSWDCSCHGSRFSEQGKLLDNPATGDLKDPPAGK